MKKGIAAVALIGIMAFAISEVFAQRGPQRGPNRGITEDCCNGSGYGRGPRGGGRPYEGMKYRLGLSEKQIEKIFNIKQKYREKIFKSRNNYDKVVKLREEMRKEVDKVLTKEQRAKLKNRRYAGRGGCPYSGKGRGRNRGGNCGSCQ